MAIKFRLVTWVATKGKRNDILLNEMRRILLVLVLWIDLSQAACRSLRPLELVLDSVSVGELELERSSSLDTDIDIGARARADV